MEAPITTRRKPPYASAAAVDAFFDKIKTIGPPPVVDSKWATAYGLDPKLPSSIPTMLRWIGVVDDDFKPTAAVWNKIRFPNSRPETLAPLVREGYREVFNAITVEDATKEILQATFAQVYGSGDVGRLIVCFLTLCNLAGIQTTATTGKKAPTEDGTPKLTKRTVISPSPKRVSNELARKAKGTSLPLAVTLNLSIEIPSEWTEEQIEKRIESITKALQARMS